MRKPKDYQVTQLRDLIQLDILDRRPLPGVALKHFTVRDIIDVYSQVAAITAAHFLGELEQRMPFSARAIQVGGSSEFEVVFEEACQRRGIKLFVLPSCLPKLNGYVERARWTHTGEFYEVTESSFDITELRGELLEWERIYNVIRPHKALGYVTPLRFLEQWKECQERRMRH